MAPRPKPRDAAPGWPVEPAADPAVEKVRGAVAALALAVEERGMSLRTAGATIGVPHVTLRGVLKGDHWPDALLIARAETALATRLWPPTDHAAPRN